LAVHGLGQKTPSCARGCQKYTLLGDRIGGNTSRHRPRPSCPCSLISRDTGAGNCFAPRGSFCQPL